jgi:acyl-homoserine lactone acylase PvdQ
VRRAVLAALVASVCLAAPAAAQVQPYQQNDGRGFWSILPPGQNGLDTALDVAKYQANGSTPPHNGDQLGMYGDLVYATPGLKREDLEKYFKDESFGVKPGDVARTYSPRDDVTIVRDKGFGIPHIYGKTRAGTMFGSGYAQAEDRLFFMDVFRHVGAAEGASFLGGAARAFDHQVWAQAPYRREELRQQFELYDDRFGPEAAQVQEDTRNYTDGINQYIAEAKLNPNKMPVEYAALEQPGGAEPFEVIDTIYSGIVLGAILGVGGGDELDSALALEAAKNRFGAKRGKRVWRDFRSAEDPEAPVTILKKKFPYQRPPKKVARGSRAMPDPGSVKEVAVSSSGAGAGSREALKGHPFLPHLPKPGAMSNALLVSARESESGHPVVVFGPQTGYFAPQPLIEVDLHGPGIDARGAAVTGTPYVALGRGRDYAWSATSSGHDYIDTFALDLCEPDGSKPTIDSMYYMFRGSCQKIDLVEKTNSWSPNAVDSTPAGSETLRAERTALGLGTARATVHGKPVLYTKLRATYGHEVDRPALAVSEWNSPDYVHDARSFQRAASKMTYTFNWFYADDRDIAYFLGGANPIRAKGVDQNLPVRGTKKFEWRNFDPTALKEAEEPYRRHPQVINQRYITNWNNKPARAFRASDANFSYSSLYRSLLLEDRIKRGIKGPNKMSLVELIDAMEDAGTVDLRADKILPWALRVLGRQSDPALADAIAKLKAWRRDGSHRRDSDRDRVYSHSDAIRILDAWWPLWVEGQFKPTLGDALWKLMLARMGGIDNSPNNEGAHLGSAYQDAPYGQVQKDLRAVLGRRVKGRYSRVYCGRGSRGRCREMLASTLREALKVPASKLYQDAVCGSQPTLGPPDPGRKQGDQWCFDSVFHTAASAITEPVIHWINRPTWQQALEIQSHRPR